MQLHTCRRPFSKTWVSRLYEDLAERVPPTVRSLTVELQPERVPGEVVPPPWDTFAETC